MPDRELTTTESHEQKLQEDVAREATAAGVPLDPREAIPALSSPVLESEQVKQGAPTGEAEEIAKHFVLGPDNNPRIANSEEGLSDYLERQRKKGLTVEEK